MPTAKERNLLGELLGIMGDAGRGKSIFAVQSPQPHAVLCLDKAVIATLPDDFPGYDPALTFFTPYFPPSVDLTKDDIERDRSVMDKLKLDVMTLRNALYAGDATFKMHNESWPLPRTIILEGGDFLRKNLLNHYLARHGKHNMSDFEAATLPAWGAVGDEFYTVIKMLTSLPALRPVNVVLTIGIKAEEVMKRNERGKMELTSTGWFDPAFGGKMGQEAPRMFRNFWMATAAAGRFCLVTQPDIKYERYRGIRSGQFGLKPVEDVTIDLAKPVNHFNRLLGGAQ